MASISVHAAAFLVAALAGVMLTETDPAGKTIKLIRGRGKAFLVGLGFGLLLVILKAATAGGN
jgi:hypothetical protein